MIKKYITMPILIFLLFVVTGFAQSPPTQQYEDTSNASGQKTSAVVSAPLPIQNPATTPNLAVFQASVDQLNQNFALFQQSINNRLQVLNERMQVLERNLMELKNNIDALHKALQQEKTPSALGGILKNKVSWMNKFKLHCKNFWHNVNIETILLGFGGIGAALILLIWALWPNRTTYKTEEDIKDEYDYLGSAEGVAAKLDLARAYVAMDDLAAAKQVLEDVQKHGKYEQQQEANMMLVELSSRVT